MDVGISGNLCYNFLVCLVYAAYGMGYFFFVSRSLLILSTVGP